MRVVSSSLQELRKETSYLYLLFVR